MVYSKDDNEVYTVEKVLRRAGAGFPLLISFFYFKECKVKIKEFVLYEESFTRKKGKTLQLINYSLVK